MPPDLTGRVALVTGGARGQGRAHALALAGAGADVAICDLPTGSFEAVPYALADEDALETTAAEVRALGRSCVAQPADVTSLAQLEFVVERTLAELGGLDIVIANAGVMTRGAPSWELTEEERDRLMAVNLKGVWLTCKATVPHLLERGSGAIVMTSSVGGLVGTPGIANYVASKHGVIGYMRSLANEVGPHGIRVNAICPGGVDNAMLNAQNALDAFGGAGPGRGTREDMLATVRSLALMPPGMLADEDIAQAVLWLVSDEARWVTGVALPVDAGMAVKLG